MELKEIAMIRVLIEHIESVQEQLKTIEDMRNDDYVCEEVLNITETELRKELEFYETELKKVISG